MLLFDHLRRQLDPSLLRLHWAKLNIDVPTYASDNVLLGLVMLVVYLVVMLVRVVVFVIVVLVIVVGSVLQWRLRSSRPAASLVETTDRFVLVLRPFGGDGRSVIHPSPIGGGATVPRTRLLESIVGAAAATVGARPIGILDQRRMLVPRGVSYHPAGDDWLEIVGRLATRADAIVAIAPPDSIVRSGFDDELDLLASRGLADKTILLAAPDDRAAMSVLTTASKRLGWPAPRGDAPVVAYLDGHDISTYQSYSDDPLQAAIVEGGLRRGLAHIIDGRAVRERPAGGAS